MVSSCSGYVDPTSCRRSDARREAVRREAPTNAPSNKPSPLSAFEGWQYQLRSFILNSPSFSVTSVGVMAVQYAVRLRQHHT